MTRARRYIGYPLAVLVVATATVAATATAASAAPTGAVVATASITVSPGVAGRADVTCPPGKTALGGGFARAASLIVVESRPLSSQWTVLALNPTSAAATLIAYAVCANVEFGGRPHTHADVVVQPNSAATVTAKCPSGWRLTGGGFLVDEYPQVPGLPADMLASLTPYWSLPDPAKNSWTVKVVNLSASTRLARAFAVCASPASSVPVTTTATLAPGQYTSVDAICPANTVASGAGWSYGGTGVRMERALLPRGTTAAPTVPKGWSGLFLNSHTQSTIQVVTRAVCIPAA